MPGHCTFNATWLSKYSWIRRSQSKYKAECCLCTKNIDISNMGEAALTSHMKSAKHSRLATRAEKELKIMDVMNVTKRNSEDTPPVTVQSTTTVKTATLESFVSSNDVLKAEILWTLNVVNSHYSFKSCDDVVPLFQSMFPDSNIASKMTCGERKAAYIASFGIGPYLSNLVKENTRSCSEFVLLFDESLNSKLQKKQLDFHSRIWNGSQVTSRYYTSTFMGHASASDLYDEFHKTCGDIGFQNLLQLSMDGPNVNWKLYKLLAEDIEKECHKKLLNVGSCGLHVVHNSFRAGNTATKWDLESWMSCLFYLFDESPARREDFISVTGSQLFPLQFCKHRWLENVADRALQVWPNVKIYLQAAKSKKVTEPQNKSYKALLSFSQDGLLEAKVQVFLSIAKVITPFLTKYQTDMPMLPFMSSDILRMNKCLLDRFVKPDVLEKCSSVTKLISLDVKDSDIHLPAEKIDVGFVTQKLITESKSQKKVSDKEVYGFRVEVKNFLVATVQKILEKSPVKYRLVRSLEWMVPCVLITMKERSQYQFKQTLNLLVDAKRVDEGLCDTTLSEFPQFREDMIKSSESEKFIQFEVGQDRLDSFYHEYLNTSSEYRNLWRVTKMLLLLSHGQATVERGFSFNKEAMLDNMAEQSLVAKRAILDHLGQVGGIGNVEISKKMLVAAAGARSAYYAHLEEQRLSKKTEEQNRKRKSLLDEIEEIKKKRKRFEDDIKTLSKSADDYAFRAETVGKVSLISKSNAMRRAVKEKEQSVQELNEQLAKKVQEFSN